MRYYKNEIINTNYIKKKKKQETYKRTNFGGLSRIDTSYTFNI